MDEEVLSKVIEEPFPGVVEICRRMTPRALRRRFIETYGVKVYEEECSHFKRLAIAISSLFLLLIVSVALSVWSVRNGHEQEIASAIGQTTIGNEMKVTPDANKDVRPAKPEVAEAMCVAPARKKPHLQKATLPRITWL